MMIGGRPAARCSAAPERWPCCAAGSRGRAAVDADRRLRTTTSCCCARWLAMLGSGVAFALARSRALVIDHSRPSGTGWRAA
jgi:hypothetical protein